MQFKLYTTINYSNVDKIQLKWQGVIFFLIYFPNPTLLSISFNTEYYFDGVGGKVGDRGQKETPEYNKI